MLNSLRLILELPVFNKIAIVFEGFLSASTLNSLLNDAEDQKRGSSPSKAYLRLIQGLAFLFATQRLLPVLEAFKLYGVFFWSIFLGWGGPFLLYLKPSIKDFTDYKIALQKHCATLSPNPKGWWQTIKNRHVLFFNDIVQNAPLVRYVHAVLFYTLNWYEQHANQIALAIGIVGYTGLFLIGSYTLAIASLVTITIGAVERNNYLSLKVSNFIKTYVNPGANIANLIFGSFSDRLHAILKLSGFVPHFFKSVLITIFRIVPFKINFIEALKEQQRVIKQFDFTVSAENFWESLNQLQHREMSVVRAHVRDDKVLLPPRHSEQQFSNLLTLFDAVDWHKHSNAIEQAKHSDWQLISAKKNGTFEEIFPKNLNGEALKTRNLHYMRNNIVELISTLANNKNLHSLNARANKLRKRYYRAIIYNLKQLPPDSNELIDKLILLGFESANYCPDNVIDTAAEMYNSLFPGSKQSKDLKTCEYRLLQQNRERFFTKCYMEQELQHLYVEHLTWMRWPRFIMHKKIIKDVANNRHAKERAIGFWGTGLGLPSVALECSLLNGDIGSSLINDILSARSHVEQAFWQEFTVETAKKQIKEDLQISAQERPMIPMKVVYDWFNQFIDSHVQGSHEAKEQLKLATPFTSQEITPGRFLQEIREEVLTLMLLDTGVIYLQQTPLAAENKFRFVAKDIPQEVPAAVGKGIHFAPQPTPQPFRTPLPAPTTPALPKNSPAAP